MWRRLDHQESVRPRGRSAVAVVLRVTLKVANTLLALLGVAVMVYAVYMYGEVHRRPAPTPAAPPQPAHHYSPPPPPAHHHSPPPPPAHHHSPPPPPAHHHSPPPPPAHHHSSPPPLALPAALLVALAAGGAETAAKHAAMPWFIYAFFGAGLFTFITAATGLVGAARNNRVCLGLYAFLAIVLLLAQGALALAFFADAHWQKRFPPDETGEARKLRRWIAHRMDVCKWIGLALLLLQVLSVALAFALSAAQARALEGDSEEEDEVWGRRQPLLDASAAGATAGTTWPPGDVEAPAAPSTPAQEDPWSQRMRDKYGLDTSQFSYTPPAQPAGGAAPATSPSAAAQEGQQQGSRCSIM